MTGRINLSALLEMLADAAAMGAGKSDIMDKLQLRADNAKAFEAKAAPCLAAIEATTAASTAADMEAAAVPSAAAATDESAATAEAVESSTAADTAAAAPGDASSAASQPAKISLAALESLVQEGQAIGIKLDSLTDLTRLLHAAHTWSQQAKYCLTGKEPHSGKHKRHPPRPSLQKVTSLVSELQYIAVLLPQAEDLCKRQQEALDWVDKAARVLQQGNLGQHLPDVQAVVQQGAAFGLEMPELTQLDALVRAIEWNSRVKQALQLPMAPSHAVLAQQQSTAAEQLPAAGGPHSMQQEGHRAPCDVPMAGTPSSMGRAAGDRGSPHPAGPAAQATALGSSQNAGLIPKSERLTLSEAEALAEQGQELPVEPAVLQHLVDLMECGQRWEAEASERAYLHALLACRMKLTNF